MIFQTKEEMWPYFGFRVFYVQRKDDGGYKIKPIRLKNDNVVGRPLSAMEFIYEECGHDDNLHVGSLDGNAVITALDEARNWLFLLVGNTPVSEHPHEYIVQIYKGNLASGFQELDKELLHWHADVNNRLSRTLTLDEIYTQAVKNELIAEKDPLTVFYSQPSSGVIYECNHSGKGLWRKLGVTEGYA